MKKKKILFWKRFKIINEKCNRLKQNSKLLVSINIIDDSVMGPDVVIIGITHDHSRINIPMNTPDVLPIEKQVVIRDDVWIGTRVIILPGVEVGNHSMIGADSVVTKSFPPYSIIAGVPAILIKKRQ